MAITIMPGQKRTYIYLCGISPVKEVKLYHGITLLPAKSDPNPNDMIDSIMKSNHASELELGLLISTLRMTSAQICIEDNDEEQLMKKTWNSQQLCVQISAIMNCDLSWFFQANKPIEQFDATTDVHMIIENMYKLPNQTKALSEHECNYLEKNISKAYRLIDNPKYYTASNAMWSYRLSFMRAIKLSVIWGGIESLFLVDSNIKNTIAIVSSQFIYGDNRAVSDIKELYKNARCKAIHEYKNGNDEMFDNSVNLLHSLLIKCIETESVPDVNQLMNNEHC